MKKHHELNADDFSLWEDDQPLSLPVHDSYHDPPWTDEITCRESASATVLSQVQKTESDEEELEIASASERFVKANAESGCEFIPPITPETQAGFKLLSRKKSIPIDLRSKYSFAYTHTQVILSRYTIRRIGPDVYVYRSQFGAFELLTENAIKTLIRSDLDEDTQCCLSKFEMADIVERIQTEPTINVPADYFDGQDHFVSFLNGTLDIQTGVLLPHSPDHKLTQYIRANYAPNRTLDGSLFSQ